MPMSCHDINFLIADSLVLESEETNLFLDQASPNIKEHGSAHAKNKQNKKI